tara:strand:- start:364 stop:561 length:198 start_codon:yes stop_codon:yes gene_type:complete
MSETQWCLPSFENPLAGKRSRAALLTIVQWAFVVFPGCLTGMRLSSESAQVAGPSRPHREEYSSY